MPDPSDPVFACLQVETPCPVNETDTSERAYRDVISNIGEWTVGDTIVLKLQTPGTGCRLFGFERSGLGSTDVHVKTSVNVPVSGTLSGLGTTQVTFTLTESAPAGDTLTVCYRTGCPGVYTALAEDRGNDDINLHAVDIDNPLGYVEVYGRVHPWSGDPNLPDILRVTGMGLQTNPPS
jgi:hypothetical protein